MRNRIVAFPWIAFAVLALASLWAPLPTEAQSGRGVMKGWVAFDGVAYVDKQPRATVELARTEGSQAAYRTETDEHGFYQFDAVSPGEYRLRISAPRFSVYETEIFIPSDFVGNLAVMLKPVISEKVTTHKNKPAAQ